MGNCSPKGVAGECSNTVRILTSSGVILRFTGPTLVKDVLVDYSGHGIFRRLGDRDSSSPLSEYEYLVAGQFYYLLPLRGAGSSEDSARNKSSSEEVSDSPMKDVVIGPAFRVLTSLKNGVWRVKLVINTEQLGEILSEDENTEALIEKMRVAAATATIPAKPRRSSRGSAWKLRPGLCNALKVSSSDGV